MVFRLKGQCPFHPQDESEDLGGGNGARNVFIKDGTGLKMVKKYCYRVFP